MTFDLLIAERRMKRIVWVVHHSTWPLSAIAASLMLTAGSSAISHRLSLWLLGYALVALVLSMALRRVARRLVQRNVEDQIVKDLRTFFQVEPASPVKSSAWKNEPVSDRLVKAPSRALTTATVA